MNHSNIDFRKFIRLAEKNQLFPISELFEYILLATESPEHISKVLLYTYTFQAYWNPKRKDRIFSKKTDPKVWRDLQSRLILLLVNINGLYNNQLNKRIDKTLSKDLINRFSPKDEYLSEKLFPDLLPQFTDFKIVNPFLNKIKARFSEESWIHREISYISFSFKWISRNFYSKELNPQEYFILDSSLSFWLKDLFCSYRNIENLFIKEFDLS